MTDISLLALLIANAARIVAFNYVVGFFTIDAMDPGGLIIIIIILSVIFILTMTLLIKELRRIYK